MTSKERESEVFSLKSVGVEEIQFDIIPLSLCRIGILQHSRDDVTPLIRSHHYHIRLLRKEANESGKLSEKQIENLNLYPLAYLL
jgi:hypothetical protein